MGRPRTQRVILRRFADGTVVTTRDLAVQFRPGLVHMARSSEGVTCVVLEPEPGTARRAQARASVHVVDDGLRLRRVFDLPPGFAVASLAAGDGGWIVAFGTLAGTRHANPAFAAWRARPGAIDSDCVSGRLPGAGEFRGGVVAGGAVHAFGRVTSDLPLPPARDRHLGDDDPRRPVVATFDLAGGAVRWQAIVGNALLTLGALDRRPDGTLAVAGWTERMLSEPRGVLLLLRGDGAVLRTVHLEARARPAALVADRAAPVDLVLETGAADSLSIASGRTARFDGAYVARVDDVGFASLDAALLCETGHPRGEFGPALVGRERAEYYVLAHDRPFDGPGRLRLFAVERPSIEW